MASTVWPGTGPARSFSPPAGTRAARCGTQACLATFKIGDSVEDQQVGCLWSGPHMISVILSRFNNFLDPEKPKRIVKGHNKPVTKLIVS